MEHLEISEPEESFNKDVQDIGEGTVSESREGVQGRGVCTSLKGFVVVFSNIFPKYPQHLMYSV